MSPSPNSQSSLWSIPAKGSHTHTVILLHPRYVNGCAFMKQFLKCYGSSDQTLDKIFPSFKWIFVQAPQRPSYQLQKLTSQWFDMWNAEDPKQYEELQYYGIKDNTAFVHRVIKAETQHVPHNRIILGGAGQGCAMAILALLYRGVKLGGFIGLSGWLPFKAHLEKSYVTMLLELDAIMNWIIRTVDHEQVVESRAIFLKPSPLSPLNTPAFIYHAEDDKTVSFQEGRDMAITLHRAGMVLSWKEIQNGNGELIEEPDGVDRLIEFIRTMVEGVPDSGT